MAYPTPHRPEPLHFLRRSDSGRPTPARHPSLTRATKQNDGASGARKRKDSAAPRSVPANFPPPTSFTPQNNPNFRSDARSVITNNPIFFFFHPLVAQVQKYMKRLLTARPHTDGIRRGRPAAKKRTPSSCATHHHQWPTPENSQDRAEANSAASKREMLATDPRDPRGRADAPKLYYRNAAPIREKPNACPKQHFPFKEDMLILIRRNVRQNYRNRNFPVSLQTHPILPLWCPSVPPGPRKLANRPRTSQASFARRQHRPGWFQPNTYPTVKSRFAPNNRPLGSLHEALPGHVLSNKARSRVP